MHTEHLSVFVGSSCLDYNHSNDWLGSMPLVLRSRTGVEKKESPPGFMTTLSYNIEMRRC